MTLHAVIVVAVYCALVLLLTRPLGIYLHRVFSGGRAPLDRVLGPLERLVYRACGVDPESEMRWTSYALSMLAFNLVGVLVLYGLLRLQGLDPWNPGALGGLRPDLALNAAVSFVTNTNWQSFSPELTVTYASQMLAFTWQNFVSAATGLALAIALMRGLSRRSSATIGNFWADLTRSFLYVLLPLSLVLAVALVSQGVVQSLGGAEAATTVEGGRQVLARGPVASQEAIKMVGTNGGGFFNANSAHPYENPTPLSNLLQVVAIFCIPAALTYTFGRFVGDQRQGWALFGAMAVLFIAGLGVVVVSEQAGNPVLTGLGVEQAATESQGGGNMEGKEVRFGIAESALFGTVTTSASCGAVNSMHDSYTPLGGAVLLLNIVLGELIFGGVGAGLMGIIVFAVLAVFISGLMVGRTPEYLGKKIESREVQMAILAVLVLAASILGFAALGVATDAGLAGRLNQGPHGLSEILYAFSSGTGNNGSAFAGLSANTPFYNYSVGAAMLIGRFLFLIPVLAIAGSMAAKGSAPPSAGTFRTDNGIFVGLLVAVVLVVGGLTFFPVFALGPIVEHFLMRAGELF